MTSTPQADLAQFFADLKAQGKAIPADQVADIKKVIEDLRYDIETAVKPLVIYRTRKIPLVHTIVANAINAAIDAELVSLTTQLEDAL